MINKHLYKKLQPWLVCLSAAFFFFYLVLQLAVFNTIGAGLMRDFGIQTTVLSQLSATYYYTCSLLFLPAGLLFDRFSTKKLLLINAVLCIVGTGLIAVTSTLSIAFLGRILVGISNPFSFLGPMRLVSRWFPKHRAAFVMGLMVAIGMSGGIVAQAPFELLMHAVGGWRNAMLVNVGLGLVITLLMFIFVKDKPNKPLKQALIQKTTKQTLGFMKSLKLATWNKQNFLCGLYAGLINLPLPILGALWGNLYLMQSKGYTSIEAGNLLMFIFVGLILGPPLIGWISDKLGRRKPPMLFSAIAILLPMMAVIYFDVSPFTLAFILFALGFISGAQTLSYPVAIESNPPEIESTSLSFVSILVNVISAGSQILIGLLINLDWNGALVNGVPFYTKENFNFALSFMILGFIACIVVALFIRETLKKNKREEDHDYHRTISGKISPINP